MFIRTFELCDATSGYL